MFRRLAALALVLVVGLGVLVTGCNNKGPKRKQIGFLMTLDHPYWNGMRRGAEDEAKKLGAEITVEDAREEPVRQIKQIQGMIAKKVDIVCIVPMKEEPLVDGIKMLNEKGIPVIVVNREVGEGCDYVCYTGTDTYEGAVTSANILMEQIGGKGEIVEFHQHLGSGPELARSKALTDVLAKYPDVVKVARLPHDGKAAIVVKNMQTLLRKHPDLKGVYAHGDVFAIAAADTCREAGRGDIKCVGMGGSEEAIQAIRDGLLAGSSYQQPEEEGRSGVRLAVKLLKGEKLEKRYPIPCPPITKENAHKYKGQF
ncbi:MAG: sugar ABC transporter substrate-binding protein [Planctomycetota bacterium]|jgi:ABC-type sugar transport system substrate-binding protein